MNEKQPMRGDIFWADLEPVEGSEQGKSRPVFIVSNNLMNLKAPIVIIVPMTKVKGEAKKHPFNIEFEFKNLDINDEYITKLKSLGHHYVKDDGYFLCNQMRAISKERLLLKLGKVGECFYISEIESAIIDSCALDACQACFTPLREGSTRCSNPKCKKQVKKRCLSCQKVNPLHYNYCPKCGRGI